MYITADRFYCTKCRKSFFVGDQVCYPEDVKYCPQCGGKSVKHTSSFWFIERERPGEA